MLNHSQVESLSKNYYKVRRNYYKLRQLSLLQSAIDCYYKLRQVLQSAVIITNCDNTVVLCFDRLKNRSKFEVDEIH